MPSRLLPERPDRYEGHPIVLWLFIPITLVTIGRSLVHVFKHDGGAQSIATIPLDAMTQGGAAAVITVFALWGLSQLLIGVFYLIVLVRYRGLIPLMLLGILVEYAGRYLIGELKPLATAETPPGVVGNYVMMAAGLVLLGLSLRRTQAIGDD